MQWGFIFKIKHNDQGYGHMRPDIYRVNMSTLQMEHSVQRKPER